MEDIPYRKNPYLPDIEAEKPADNISEAEKKALFSVQKMLGSAIESLSKDYNILFTEITGDTDNDAKNLLMDIRVKKQVYQILSPLKSIIDDEISQINNLTK